MAFLLQMQDSQLSLLFWFALLRVLYPGESESDSMVRFDLESFIRWLNDLPRITVHRKKEGPTPKSTEEVVMGRLASSIEGGGKRRVFAIVNFVKQCLLLRS
jgi:hypothetical protein